MVVYLSGKITGLEPKIYRHNFRMGISIAKDQIKREIIDSLGLEKLEEVFVINPVEIGEEVERDLSPKTPSWSDYMKADIIELIGCDGIFMLEGWEDSKGAKLELNIAENLGLKIYYQK